MRAGELVRAAVRNSLRSRIRTTLTALALLVGAFTLTLTTALGAGVSAYVNAQVAALGAGDVLLISKSASGTGPQRYDPTTSTGSGSSNPLTGTAQQLSDGDLDRLRSIEGLRDVQGLRSVAVNWIRAGSGPKYELAIAPTSSIGKAGLAAGAQLDPASNKRQLLLPSEYVRPLRLGSARAAVGVDVELGVTDVLGRSHVVAAVVTGVSNRSLLFSGAGANAALLNELATIQRAGVNAPDRYPVAVARMPKQATPAEVQAFKTRVTDRRLSAQTIADQLGVVQTVITGITGVLNAFAVVALLAAAFGIVNTLLMSVQERTREIGLMKALGMSGGRVFSLFSLEAAFIGLLGSVVGATLAVLTGTALSAALTTGPLAGLEGLQLLLFRPATVIGVIALIVLIAFVSGTLPAARAARRNPIDALRYE